MAARIAAIEVGRRMLKIPEDSRAQEESADVFQISTHTDPLSTGAVFSARPAMCELFPGLPQANE